MGGAPPPRSVKAWPLYPTTSHFATHLSTRPTSWPIAELDSAGRVTLNPALIEHAGIDREVVIVGNLDHLEVWDRRRWAEERTQLNDEISGIAESLGHPS